MRALFTSALLTVGAFASNSKSHGPWDIMIGQFAQTQVKQGTIGITTDWAKKSGQADIAEIKYTVEVTREQVMKDNANTQKLTLWWPNAAGDSAELNVLLMSNSVAWEYKYGTVPNYDNSDRGLASVTAAPNPTDNWRFMWYLAIPKKISTINGFPHFTSTRWNPDVESCTNSDDVLNMTFYRRLDTAETTTLLSSGRVQ